MSRKLDESLVTHTFSSRVSWLSPFRKPMSKSRVRLGLFCKFHTSTFSSLFQTFNARFFAYYATELPTLSVTYPLCGSAVTDTKDNPSEMFPLKLTDFCLFLYTIDHTQSYKGRLFPQWLSQVVMTGAQTCYPEMGEPAL